MGLFDLLKPRDIGVRGSVEARAEKGIIVKYL